MMLDLFSHTTRIDSLSIELRIYLLLANIYMFWRSTDSIAANEFRNGRRHSVCIEPRSLILDSL